VPPRERQPAAFRADDEHITIAIDVQYYEK
jgi:hypothetical protein